MKINKIEKLKKELSPYDFFERLTSLDFDNLSEADRFYLKNYGIYNIKLRPENFMLRIRIAGGRIDVSSLYTIAKTAQKYHLEPLITTRAQIELHGLNSSNVLEVWKTLLDAKITTLQTLTDNFRNIVTDPLDGIALESRIEVYSIIKEMEKLFLNQKEWMGMLPRKFNTAICGTLESSVHFFGNDLFFALAQKDDIWGFNLYLGGKNSEVAKDANIFVKPQEVTEVFEAVARTYLHYGFRSSRSRTRLFHLIDEIGIDAFRTKMGEFYCRTVRGKGQLHLNTKTYSAYSILQDNTYGYCLQSYFGRIDGAFLHRVAEFASGKDLQLRLGIDQNLYIVGLKEKEVPFMPVQGASHIIACAGSRYCALSLWDVKEETVYLPLERLIKHHVTVGFSGCLKGCGRHHHEDIGLVGLRTNLFGPVIKAARVFLGTEYTQTQRAARLIFHVVPLDKLSSLIDVILDEYERSSAVTFESFSREYLNRFSSGFLMMWFLAKLFLEDEITFGNFDEKSLYQMLLQKSDFPAVEGKSEGYEAVVRIMLHSLWDVNP